jgi:GNAT superfamily N-acetyltransferase
MDVPDIAIRPARIGDYLALLTMQTRSVRQLGRKFYTQQEIDRFIHRIGTMDSVLLEEGSYWVVQVDGIIAASGGWSLRRPGYARREAGGVLAADSPLPKIRSVFVDPAHGRRGLGRLIMARVEEEIATAGHRAAELISTLNAVPFYAALGFRPGRPAVLDLGGGVRFRGLGMAKELAPACRLAA